MSSQPQTVNLADLDLPSLQQVKTQLEEELSHLTQSYGKLKNAQVRFADCAESVVSLKGEKANGNCTLVFLFMGSNYLYVPGKLSDVEKVIVDIGTGYYVEKTLEGAENFYQGKGEYVTQNLEKLQEAINGKQSSLRAIVSVMQDKIQQQQQQAAAAK
ncbi:prefoldin, alpha subunit [Zychaea mexicana]|uniref:prefoldin, alpha subunit n=1 Tax=Zychaea mexicana TaxID=64656 RepID=UPI0022FF3051|nr:prefoldin, alpha subunit [Zychaea mexicana]KAI9493964.1 prefoldin, alpha subunit [Zychaea mexicana]